MQPDNQQPQTPPTTISPSGQSGGSDYDFITNASKSPQKSNMFNGKNTLQRVAVVVGLLVIVLIVFSIGRSLLGGKSNTPQFLSVAQNQQQIIELSNNALQVSGLTLENRNFAVTTKVSVASDQKLILNYLKNKKFKTNDQLLNKTIDAKASKKLADSIANNTYNDTFKTIMQEKLQLYQDSLVSAYQSSKTANTKKVLEDISSSADILQKMIENPST